MNEEFMKHCTDCVYFLASPFTCKKGVECEYRHSDAARLNPVDCWYWLSGTCSNLNCPFRHPPLDVLNEESIEAAAPLPNQSTVPATKTTVPCYYYYSGFCKKGDCCPFLHEPGDTFTWNSKTENLVTDAPIPAPGGKSTVKSDTVPILTHAEIHPSEFKKAIISCDGSELQQRRPPQAAQEASIKNDQDPNNFVQSYGSEREEMVPVESVSLQPSEDSPRRDGPPNFVSDRSSEDLVDGNVVRDEWWESSPGFDVLVDGKTHDLAYEDDLEYIPHQIESDGDRDPVFVQYGFEANCDKSRFFSNGLYDSSEHLDSELITNYGSFSPRCRRDKEVGHIDSRKRKFCSVESSVRGCNIVDLRDHLRRKRMIDCYLDTHDLRHDLVQRRYDGTETIVRLHSNYRSHGRLASSVERNGVLLDRQTTGVAASGLRIRPRNLQRNDHMKFNGLRRHNSSGFGRRRSYLKRENYSTKLTKAAKSRSHSKTEDDKRQEYRNKNVSVDFEGPKPLSEILKEKKKTIDLV
ncbi:hypothetical protein vseg_016421 [Gypsophila vaccaria]